MTSSNNDNFTFNNNNGQNSDHYQNNNRHQLDDGPLNNNEVLIEEIIDDEFRACEFCATQLPEEFLVKLQTCPHLFCRPCLAFLVETSLDAQIECPMFAHCYSFLLDSDIKKIVTDEVYESYLSRSIARALESNEGGLKYCYGPNCTGICEVDLNIKSYYCPTCNKLNCLYCSAIHEVPCDNGRNSPVDYFEESGIPAKVPKFETEEERKLRVTWENSWDDLRKKYQSSASDGIDPATIEGLSLNAGSLINTQNRFECQICLMEIDSGDGVFLQECLHRFCRECLTGHIQHSEEAEIKCPFRLGNFSCPMTILEREVKSLISDEEHDKILKKSLMAAEMGAGNSVHCQSVNCTGWVVVESEDIKSFVCFICDKKNCIPCKAIHGTLTCEEFKSSLASDKKSADALEKLLETRSASRCPKCNILIIKNGGCDHMYCVACKTHFNWSDGTLWPTHNPDGTPLNLLNYGRIMVNQEAARIAAAEAARATQLRGAGGGGAVGVPNVPLVPRAPRARRGRPPAAAAAAPPPNPPIANPPPQNPPPQVIRNNPPPPQNANYYAPPQNANHNAPPRRNATQTAPAPQNAHNAPPQNANQNAPPPRPAAQNTHPQNANYYAPTPQNANINPPRRNATQTAPPPQNANYNALPPRTAAQNAPPQNANYNAPPRTAAQNAPPQNANQNAPPRTATQNPPPQNANYNAPPRTAAQNAPPQNANQNAPPRTAAQNAPQLVAQYNAPAPQLNAQAYANIDYYTLHAQNMVRSTNAQVVNGNYNNAYPPPPQIFLNYYTLQAPAAASTNPPANNGQNSTVSRAPKAITNAQTGANATNVAPSPAVTAARAINVGNNVGTPATNVNNNVVAPAVTTPRVANNAVSSAASASTNNGNAVSTPAATRKKTPK